MVFIHFLGDLSRNGSESFQKKCPGETRDLNLQNFSHQFSEPLILKAAALLLVLAALHLISPFFRKLSDPARLRFISFSGGFVVSYVFLRLLPGLAESQNSLGSLLEKTYRITPLLDLTIYFVGLIGMLIFFGLKQWAQAQKEKHPQSRNPEFYIHLVSMIILNMVIGYTMPLRVQVGEVYSYLFTLVMACHFMVVDKSLERRFPIRFKSWGRYILALALMLGWFWAVWDEPDSALTVALLNAFLGGSVLMNVFRNQIPASEKEFSFSFFVMGSLTGSLLLGMLAYVQSY